MKPPPSKLPIAVFDIHDFCNQRCTYCVTSSSPSRDFGFITEPASRTRVERFFASHGPFNVLFTGGEPTITPGVADFFRLLVEQGHRVSLQTNLKKRPVSFSGAVPAEASGWILASFHSVALNRFDSFLRNALELRREGYRVVVKFLLDEAMMPEFPRLNDVAAEAGLGVMCSPIINYPADAVPNPHRYSPREWQVIAPRITLLSTWLFFAGGWASRDRPCFAGSRMYYLRGLGDGTIHGCSSGSPQNLGNLLNNTLTPAAAPTSCGLETCVCDFHYYTGIIPDLDDSAAFESLADGEVRQVPYDTFQEWIKDAGAETLLDLGQDLENASLSGQGGLVRKLLKSIRLPKS